jgi:nucleoid-associated protein YgaU
VRLTCSGILIISCTFFGYSQSYAQDVAEAARKEQARKESQQKKSKHVYTEEDLKHAQILTPEDRAEVEARKKQQPPPGAESSQDPIDAELLPADAPLGDVARRYRRMRESLRLQESAEFHLPFLDESVLATPKTPVMVAPEPPMLSEPTAPTTAEPKFPVLTVPKPRVLVAPKPSVLPHGMVLSIPAPPKVEPFQPPVKRSPFERPRVFLAAPPRVAPSQPTANHVAPPTAPVVSPTPARPSTVLVSPAKPTSPAPLIRLMPSPAPSHHVTSAQPTAPVVHMTPSHPSTIPVSPAEPVAPARGIGVIPSVAPVQHQTPAQPTAPVVHMAPSSPAPIPVTPARPVAPRPELRVMPSPAPSPNVKPAEPVAPLVRMTPSRPSPLGATPSQPLAPVVRVTPSQPAAPAHIAPTTPATMNVVIVKPGDSLWKLAEQELGKGILWHELLAVNPNIVDANRIMAGSQIFLPSLVSTARAAASFTVRKGDTLSAIALTQLGRASSWACIAHANPTIQDANLIFEGQLLLLPAGCTP